MLALSADGTVEYCSQTVELLLGYPLQGIVGKRFLDYVHEDDIAAFEKVFAETDTTERAEMRTGDPFEKQVIARVRSKSGDWRYLESSMRDLTVDPVIRGIVVHARDMTNRREADENLISANKRFDAAFHANPAMVAITSADTGELCSVNDKWTEIIGFSREEALSKTTFDLDIWVD